MGVPFFHFSRRETRLPPKEEILFFFPRTPRFFPEFLPHLEESGNRGCDGFPEKFYFSSARGPFRARIPLTS
jgi:hypothetical protein